MGVTKCIVQNYACKNSLAKVDLNKQTEMMLWENPWSQWPIQTDSEENETNEWPAQSMVTKGKKPMSILLQLLHLVFAAFFMSWNWCSIVKVFR